MTFGYDGRQRTNLEDLYANKTLLGFYSSTYNPDGTPQSENDPVMHDSSFTYDGVNRLATASMYTIGHSYAYNYDRWGNRWSEVEGGGASPSESVSFITPVNQKSGNNNQMSGNIYDLAGNVLSEPGGPTYSYDAESRMTGRHCPFVELTEAGTMGRKCCWPSGELRTGQTCDFDTRLKYSSLRGRKTSSTTFQVPALFRSVFSMCDRLFVNG